MSRTFPKEFNISLVSVHCQTDTSGPVFIQEPPNYVDFSNTTGTKIICQARGVPLPNITWTKSNGEPIGTVPGLRQVGRYSAMQSGIKYSG